MRLNITIGEQGFEVRFLNDFELAEYHYESRSADPAWTGLAQPPETVQLAYTIPPKKVYYSRVVELNTSAQKFCDDMNDDIVTRYLHDPFVGLNSGPWPHRMVITTGNNKGRVMEIDSVSGWYKLQTYPLAGPFPTITKEKLITGDYDHCLIHTFNTINTRGILMNSAHGIAWYPLISDCNIWIDPERIVRV